MAPQNKMEEETNYGSYEQDGNDVTINSNNSGSSIKYYENKAFEHDSTSDSKSVDISKNCENDLTVKSGEIIVNNEQMDFDDILPHIGEFGRYQKLLFLMMIPFAFFVAFVYFTQIFITLVPDEHFCLVPELMNLTKEERLKLAIPLDELGRPDKCRMYAINYTAILEEGTREADPTWPTVSCLHGWEYDRNDVPYDTISTELNWVCEESSLPALAQSIFFIGAIVGGLIFGWLADRYGRVAALLGSNMIGLIGGCATAAVSTFWAFCVCRFLVGIAFDNCFTMMYILVLEYVGPKWRTFVANMSIAIFFTMATCALPWMAWYIADWRLLALATSLPLIIAIASPWVVPESARWLVSQGQIERATEIIKKFERINRKTVDPEIYNKFTESCMKAKKEEESSSQNYSVLDLFRTPRLRNITILLIVIWMCISLVFDGHVRNVGQLGYNVFITFTVASATELPADTLLTLTLDRWGRRGLACLTMVVSGVFSLLAVFAGGPTTTAVFAIIGRFAVNISYNIGLQYAAELLPTVVRAQGVALIHIMGYVASILAPFIVHLGEISQSLPLLVLGLLGIVGGILSLFLPETLNQDLPQSLDDGEEFGKDQKMWEFPCCIKSPEDEVTPIREQFKRRCSNTMSVRRASMRASFRGEVRSSMLHRSGSLRSVRSRTTSINKSITEQV